MLRNLLAAVYALLALFWASAIHRYVFRVAGHSRAGRLGAYVLAALCYFTGIGMMLALANDGWHRTRGSAEQVHTSVPEGLMWGATFGLLFGIAYFVQGERRGGVPFIEDVPGGPEFPVSHVRDVLDVEPRTSAAECVRMARYLRKRSRRSGEPLPPELLAFVERHEPPRGRAGR